MVDFSDQESLIQKSVGIKIRELRKAVGLNMQELAGRAEISQSQLSKVENGKATISIRVLDQLCKALDRPLSYLFQSDAETPKTLGTLVTVAGPESQGLAWFSEEVRRRTTGRMSLLPLRASQLGSGSEQAEQLSQGVIDLFIEELPFHRMYAPALNLLSLPYMFGSHRELMSFLESPFFDKNVRIPLLDHGIRILNRRWNWLRGLEWVLVANRPIETPAQVRGLRVRVYDSPVLARFWEKMGAHPVAVPWGETKRALKDGEVDVLPTHKAHLYHLGFCKYAPYVTLLGDICPVLCIAMNEPKYRMLPPDIQKALEDACDASGDHFSDLVRTAEVKNEALNIARFNAQYLKVDLRPWKAEAWRIRPVLAQSIKSR